MIGYIKGTITGIFERECFIETAGVGYRVHITDMDSSELEIGGSAKLYIHMAVREDAITLYGFLEKESYDLFLELLTVSKIGPKVALSILSVMKPGVFAMAIRNKSIKSLTQIPGIGKKTAERMLVEMKDKIKRFDTGEEEEDEILEDVSGIESETIAALHSLGYDQGEVAGVVRRVRVSHPDITDAGKLIQASLRELGKEIG